MFSIYLKCDSFDKAEICILSIGLGHICVLVLFIFALIKNDKTIVPTVNWKYNHCLTVIKMSEVIAAINVLLLLTVTRAFQTKRATKFCTRPIYLALDQEDH